MDFFLSSQLQTFILTLLSVSAMICPLWEQKLRCTATLLVKPCIGLFCPQLHQKCRISVQCIIFSIFYWNNPILSNTCFQQCKAVQSYLVFFNFFLLFLQKSLCFCFFLWGVVKKCELWSSSFCPFCLAQEGRTFFSLKAFKTENGPFEGLHHDNFGRTVSPPPPQVWLVAFVVFGCVGLAAHCCAKVLLLRGRVPGSGGLAVVHRSPGLGENVRRLLLTVDALWRERRLLSGCVVRRGHNFLQFSIFPFLLGNGNFLSTFLPVFSPRYQTFFLDATFLFFFFIFSPA